MYQEKLNNQIIDISTSGNNTVIAAPTDGRYIAIDFISFFPTTAVTVTTYTGTTQDSGPLPLDAKQTITWENASNNNDGVITCKPNEAFIMDLDSAVQVGGKIRYRLIGN